MSPDVLDDLLQNAPSALPQAIQIGKHFQQCDGAVLSATVEKIQKEFESRLDGRLAMQYALSIQSAEMVSRVSGTACEMCIASMGAIIFIASHLHRLFQRPTFQIYHWKVSGTTS